VLSLRLEQATIVHRPDGSYTCRCQGSSNLPDGAYLQFLWKYARPQPAVAIVDGCTTLKQGRFSSDLGNFPASRVIFPGSYQITVFFSPALQQQKIAAEFCETNLTFMLGDETQYAALFAGEQAWLEKFLREVAASCNKIYGAYRAGQNKSDEWYRGRASREDWFMSLRQGEMARGHLYLCHPFVKTVSQLRPLVNLLEMIEEAVEISLQEKEDSFLHKRLGEMNDLYPAVYNDFLQELMALSLNPADALRAELQNCRNEMRQTPPPHRTDNVVREQAAYLVRLHLFYQEVERLPLNSPAAFVAASNDWLWRVRSIMAELSKTQEAMGREETGLLLTPYPLPGEWRTVFDSLLAAWEQKAVSAKVLTALSYPAPTSFSEHWQKFIAGGRVAELVKWHIRRESDRFALYLQTMQKKMSGESSGSEDDIPGVVVSRQADIRLLTQLEPATSLLFRDYLRVCGRLLYVDDVLSQCRQGEIGREAALAELDRLKQEIAALQAACQK
jgi:hypothetical protein